MQSHLSSPTLLLRDVADSRPVFFIHGMGGTAEEFLPVAQRVRTRRTMHALRAKGGDGRSEPMNRIGDMAAFYLDTIKMLQPEGPYTLIGFSLGGLAALEMTRILEGRGDSVDLLVMIDSYPFPKALPLWKKAKVAALKLKYGVQDAIGSRPSQDHPLPKARARKRSEFFEFVALIDYQTRFYNGEIKFVRAADSEFPDPKAVWPSLAPGMKIEIVPGDHHSVLSKDCEPLAGLLSSYLEADSPRKPPG
jgi:thioesterase domain-containing protein